MVRIYDKIHYTFCYCSQNHQLICLNFPISKSSEIKLHKNLIVGHFVKIWHKYSTIYVVCTYQVGNEPRQTDYFPLGSIHQ